jgi:hypothetical protein
VGCLILGCGVWGIAFKVFGLWCWVLGFGFGVFRVILVRGV